MTATHAPAQTISGGRGRRWAIRAANNTWSALQGLLPLIVLLLLWQVLGDPRSPYFPPPSAWAVALIDRISAGDLLPALLVTFQSVAAALVVAMALGVGIGGLIGASPGLERCLGPMLEFLRTLPPPTIVPVTTLIIGVDEKMKLFVIVFAAVWPVLLNTTSGVRSLHPTMLEATRSLQLGVAARVTKVFLPALLPSILTGVRVAAPLAIIVSLLAEMLTLMPGLGALLLMAQRNFNAAEVFGLLAVVGSFGFIINVALAAFESWVLMPQGRS